jgi:hypothetical protein
MRALLEEREVFYRLADHEIAAGTREAAEVAKDVMDLARAEAGWM